MSCARLDIGSSREGLTNKVDEEHVVFGDLLEISVIGYCLHNDLLTVVVCGVDGLEIRLPLDCVEVSSGLPVFIKNFLSLGIEILLRCSISSQESLRVGGQFLDHQELVVSKLEIISGLGGVDHTLNKSGCNLHNNYL